MVAQGCVHCSITSLSLLQQAYLEGIHGLDSMPAVLQTLADGDLRSSSGKGTSASQPALVPLERVGSVLVVKVYSEPLRAFHDEACVCLIAVVPTPTPTPPPPLGEGSVL